MIPKLNSSVRFQKICDCNFFKESINQQNTGIPHMRIHKLNPRIIRPFSKAAQYIKTIKK